MLQCGREKFITRQPRIGEKDDYDSENSWISDGLPSSSRRRRRGEGRGEGEEWREKGSASEVVVDVDELVIATSLYLDLAFGAITALARTSACPFTTAAFARTLASSLTPSKPKEGRRAEAL